MVFRMIRVCDLRARLAAGGAKQKRRCRLSRSAAPPGMPVARPHLPLRARPTSLLSDISARTHTLIEH